MKSFVVALTLALSPLTAAAAPAPDEHVADVAQLQLFSAFWPNLHHTLYAAAWAGRPDGPNVRRLAQPLPEPLDGALSAEERSAWEAAVAYYDRELASKDLLFGEGMEAIKVRLAAAPATLPETGLAPAHRAALVAAAAVYRKHWWPMHDRANRAWIADVVPRLTQIAPEVTKRLAQLYTTPWFTTPVRVDVVRVGNRQGAYTSLDPVHITISSGEPQHSQWSGAEILFHESSHGLIAPISDRIRAELRTAGKRANDLWHVVLFVTAGEVVRQTLAARDIAYRPYIYATGLFERAWPELRKPVEAEWIPYINGKVTLDEAVKRLVAACSAGL